MPLLVENKEKQLLPKKEKELRELCAELEYRKRVNPLLFYEHLPQQLAFHNDPLKDKNIFGGNRAGKTEEVAEYVITKCLAEPKQRWWACAETFPDSVNIQQRKVWEIVPKNKIAYGHYDDINGFPNRKLKLTNGSMIIFKSYDQGTMSFAQDDCDGIWDDESVKEKFAEIVSQAVSSYGLTVF